MDKVIPSAVPIEEAVLGAIMMSSSAMTTVCDMLSPESFYNKDNKKIYQACLELFTKDSPIDLLTVVQQIKASGSEIEAFKLVEMTNKVASAANIEYHAKLLQQKEIRRKLIEAGHEMVKQSFSEEMDVFDILEMSEKSVFDIMSAKTSQGIQHISTHAAQSLKRLEHVSKQGGGVSGLSTGFRNLDHLTSGLQPSDLMIVAARPGMGKTAFVLSLAANVAINVPVLIFNLEMSSRQLTDRLVSIDSGINSAKLRSGDLEEHEWKSLHGSMERVSELKLYIDDSPGLNVYELRAKARRAKMKHDIQLIVIDYLQLMSGGSGKGRNREQEVSEISRSLKCLAKELDVPVIALSQLSRAVEVRGGMKIPQLSDLRESGSIEQDADIVSFIYRPEYYNIVEDEEGRSLKGVAELIFAKHRNGALKTLKFRFDDKTTMFTDLHEHLEMSTIDTRYSEAPF